MPPHVLPKDPPPLVRPNLHLHKTPPHSHLPQHGLRSPPQLAGPDPLPPLIGLVRGPNQPMDPRLPPLLATLLDPQITHLHNGLNYKSTSTILFQRGSVIVMDFVLVYAVYRATKGRNLRLVAKMMVWAMVIWSPMLIIVDHVHFQYNGFLIGLLLISVSGLEEGRDLFGGFVFAVLICFKHLFAVAAPVYFVYLFRHYCRGGLVKGGRRFVIMGVVVLAVFVAAYGPFVYYGQVNFLLIALKMLIPITFASVLLYSACVSIICVSSFVFSDNVLLFSSMSPQHFPRFDVFNIWNWELLENIVHS